MAAVGLLYAIVTLGVVPGTIHRFRDAVPGTTDPETYVDVVWLGAAVALALAIIVLALYVVLGVALRRGSNVARIAILVVCVLGAFGGLVASLIVAGERSGDATAGSLGEQLTAAYPGGWLGTNVGLAIAQVVAYLVVGALVLTAPKTFFGRGDGAAPAGPPAGGFGPNGQGRPPGFVPSAPGHGASGGYGPGYGQGPGNTQPGYGQPGPGQPGYVQPGYVQPGYVQPGYVQPGPGQPTYPAYSQPTYDQAGYGRPGYTSPGYGQPGYTPPGYGEPGPGQPTYPPYSQPTYSQPAYAPPGYGPGPWSGAPSAAGAAGPSANTGPSSSDDSAAPASSDSAAPASSDSAASADPAPEPPAAPPRAGSDEEFWSRPPE
jgi:hypothetical protein